MTPRGRTSAIRFASAALLMALAACTSAVQSPTATALLPTLVPATPAGTPLPDNMHRIESAQAVIEALRGIDSGEIPERLLGDGDVENTGEFEPEPDDFDPNVYFQVLTHLSMEPGHTLDYVYQYDGMGGFPRLFAREEQTGALVRDESYLEHIQTDGTPEGYFELALLEMMGDQFYLWWHAAYNDHMPVATREAAQAALANTVDMCATPDMPPDASARLQAADFTPIVTLLDDTVEVRFYAFTAWGGLYENLYTFRREFPHTLLDRQTETLIAYECGIAF